MPSPERPCLWVETRRYETKLSPMSLPPTFITNGLTTLWRNVIGRWRMIKGARVMRGFDRNGDGSCHDPVPIAKVSANSPRPVHRAIRDLASDPRRVSAVASRGLAPSAVQDLAGACSCSVPCALRARDAAGCLSRLRAPLAHSHRSVVATATHEGLRVFEDAHFGPLSVTLPASGRHAVGNHPINILRRGETE